MSLSLFYFSKKITLLFKFKKRQTIFFGSLVYFEDWI